MEEIKRDSKYVYNNAKQSAPSQISIDTGLGIQSTYDINKNEYALNQARYYYQQEISNKVKIENSTISKQYDEHRLGNFVCKKDKKSLWGVSISYVGQQKDGDTLWYSVSIKPQKYA